MSEDRRIKRYIVFAYDHYYPMGGWGDFRYSTDDRDEAMEIGKAQNGDWFQAVDTMDGSVFGAGASE